MVVQLEASCWVCHAMHKVVDLASSLRQPLTGWRISAVYSVCLELLLVFLPGVCRAVLWFCDVFVPGADCRMVLMSSAVSCCCILCVCQDFSWNLTRPWFPIFLPCRGLLFPGGRLMLSKSHSSRSRSLSQGFSVMHPQLPPVLAR